MSSHQLLSACVASKLSLKLSKNHHRTISSTDSPHMKISVSNLESVDDSKPVPQQCIDENSEYFAVNDACDPLAQRAVENYAFN